MKVLHLTPKTKGYEEVILIANRFSKNNQLSVIEKNQELFITGGILLNDTEEIREFLDKIDKSKQYEFIKNIKEEPFVASYYINEE